MCNNKSVAISCDCSYQCVTISYVCNNLSETISCVCRNPSVTITFVCSNQPEVSGVLLSHGATVDALNKGLCSSLHVAVSKQHPRCVDILLRHRCNANIQVSSSPPYAGQVMTLSHCGVQWLRGRASDSRLREPRFESCAAVLKPWASFFTLHCSSSLSCIYEYLAIDSGGYVYEHPSRINCSIWPRWCLSEQVCQGSKV